FRDIDVKREAEGRIGNHGRSPRLSNRGISPDARTLRDVLHILVSDDVEVLVVKEVDCLRKACRHRAVRSVDVARNYEAAVGGDIDGASDGSWLYVEIFLHHRRRAGQRVLG